MVVGEDARLPGGRVERQNPAVFVVGGAREDHGFGAVFRPDRLQQLDVALLRRGGRGGGAPPSVVCSMRCCVAVAGGVIFWPWSTYFTSPVATSMSASRRRDCVSPTLERPGMSSVYADSVM